MQIIEHLLPAFLSASLLVVLIVLTLTHGLKNFPANVNLVH